MDENNKNTPPEETNNSNPNPVTITPEAPETNASSASNNQTTDSAINFNETNVMAAIAYLGPLVFVPFFLKKSDPFIFHHVKQGLVLFAIMAVVLVLDSWFMILHFLYPVFLLIKLGVFILSVIGVIYALKHEEKTLPLVGKFAKHFNF